jgi:hypothetical protein
MKELNWLPLSDRKNIRTIPVVFEENFGQEYGGYYDGTKIVAVESETVAATLAHEFRHHIQRELNIRHSVDGSVWRSDLPYEEAITVYFRNQVHEFDALLYEYRVVKSELNDYWLNHLVLPTKHIPLKFSTPRRPKSVDFFENCV